VNTLLEWGSVGTLWRANLQGAPIKNNPLDTLFQLLYQIFFTKFAGFTEEDSGHIGSIFHYDICYGLEIIIIWTQKYNFLSEQITTQRFWCKNNRKCSKSICQCVIMCGMLCWNTIKDICQSSQHQSFRAIRAKRPFCGRYRMICSRVHWYDNCVILQQILIVCCCNWWTLTL